MRNGYIPMEQWTAPETIATKHSTAEINPPCQFSLEGRCRFGARCRNYHSGDVGGTQHLKDHRHTHHPSPLLPSGKKPPMKTADDVISRLLWDAQVPTEYFSIGYLDRFLGIVEEPFTAFSWEDLASIGPGVLAIPKHRIQYFKFRDRIVWDKASRTDDIFGSTGSGRTILEVMKKEAAKATEEKVHNHTSNQDGGKSLEGPGKAEYTGEVDNIGSTREREKLLDIGTGGQAMVGELVEPMGNLNSVGVTHTVLDEGVVSQDPGGEVINSVRGGHAFKGGGSKYTLIVKKGNGYLEEEEGETLVSERRDRGSFPCPKQRPTHFIAIQVTGLEIREAVKTIQGALCKVCPDLAEFCVPLASLHLTLCLLRLNSPAEIYKAITALRELQANSQCLLPPALLLSFQGVETFHAHVLYMSPASMPELETLAQTLENAFSKKDLQVICAPGKEKFHLTMVKIPPGKTGPQLPASSTWIPPIEDLGTQAVEALCLCETGQGRGTSGFYTTLVKLDLY
ncbi:leukocyte receptor cluster member 9-like isoform X2 [Hemicordylus capensis]|uniref:leukocyte receptor cluster member 9-like isoform X2 n=1 Tax=Hemicordylus capensis TaxID=884348 RepID=UPI0023043760|nr:leukocyte receptor cluster member 9-like isoform X2 [Hemicordylus capensis]